jgi:hypothetical protein
MPPHIKVLSPAEFAADTVAVAPEVARRALQAMSSRFSAPPLTIDDILARLVDRYGMDDIRVSADTAVTTAGSTARRFLGRTTALSFALADARRAPLAG